MEDTGVGFRFHPTEQELINHFLSLKENGYDELVDNHIVTTDVYRRDPFELPGVLSTSSDDRVWYFFCYLEKKYANSKRVNRRTRNGFWKETGETRQIKARNKVIGTQKKLVFHYKVAGSRLGTRTHWVIHEYRRIETINDPTALVICKLKDKSNAAAVADQGEPCFSMAFDVENHTSQPTTSGVDAVELQFPIPGDTADFNVPSSFETIQNFLLSSDYDKEEDLISFADSGLNEDEINAYVYSLIKESESSEQFSNSNEAQTRTSQHRQMKSVNGDDILVMAAGSGGSSQVRYGGSINCVFAVKNGAAVDLSSKDSYSSESDEEKQYLMVLSSGPNSDLSSEDSYSNDRKSTFIRFEIPPSSHKPSPPYVYLINTAVSLIWGTIILWDMLH